MRDSATEATLAAVANKITYASGTTAVIGGFTANEVAAFGGLVVAILGLLVQVYFKLKADRREAELHKHRLDDLWGKE